METIKNQTKNYMIALGIYKPEFDMTISIYASLVYQYKQLEKQFEENSFNVSEKTGYSENSKKSPLVGAMESLRKDILSYSNSLGLTPTALRKINDKLANESKKKQSDLDKALSSFGL